MGHVCSDSGSKTAQLEHRVVAVDVAVGIAALVGAAAVEDGLVGAVSRCYLWASCAGIEQNLALKINYPVAYWGGSSGVVSGTKRPR
jgi:hypothetical protein